MAIRTRAEAKAKARAAEKAQLKLEEKAELQKLSKIPFFDPVSYKVMSVYEREDYIYQLKDTPKYETKDMDENEARMCVQEILDKTNSVMKLCYELCTRKGYKALGRPKHENGYPDFKTCVMKELKGVISYDYAHKMKNAGVVHLVVCPQLPMGSVPESVLRPLHDLDTEDEMKEVWNSEVKGHQYSDGTFAIPIARDIKAGVRAHQEKLGIIPATYLKNKFRDVKFSPKLMKKMTPLMMEFVKEFIEQTSTCPTPPVTKDHFDKVLNLLLNKLRISISEKYENYSCALSKNYDVESITSIDCKSEPEVVETVMDIITPASSDLVEDPAVSINKVTAMPLPEKSRQVQSAENMLQVKIKLPNQKHPKPKKIARNEQKPIYLKGKPLHQNSTLSPEEIKLMLPESTFPIANYETFFPDTHYLCHSDLPVLNLDFPPDMA